jgi:hypothetical protein
MRSVLYTSLKVFVTRQPVTSGGEVRIPKAEKGNNQNVSLY